MSNLSKGEIRQADVRTAAIGVFVRYGYGKATMADIAAAAGISRPALYLLFANKETLFRDLATSIMDTGLAAAQAAWPAGSPAGAGLRDCLIAKELPLFRLLKQSPHAEEILAANNRLLADLHAAHEADFAAFLAARLASARVKEPIATAQLVTHALHGLKTGNASEDGFLADIERLSRLVAGV